MNVREQKYSVFSANPIFASLTESEATVVLDRMKIERFKAGTAVFSAGESARSMYLVISGKISVLQTDDYGNRREIAKIIEKDSLGEIDMITGIPYTVTAVAETDSALLVFPPPEQTFPQFLESNPGTGAKILHALITEIAERTRTANDLLKENSPHIRELRRQIYEDKLTNLYNKTYLEENLPLWIAKKETPVCLMMIKPDNFKQVNDSAGHEAGDNLLLYLAGLLPAYIPKGSVLIRYIGNEFALIVDKTGTEESLRLAEKIRNFYNSLDIGHYLPHAGFHLTVSIGIALYPEHAGNSADLIEKAHQLPLLGRARGGNKILFPEDTAVGLA